MHFDASVEQATPLSGSWNVMGRTGMGEETRMTTARTVNYLDSIALLPPTYKRTEIKELVFNLKPQGSHYFTTSHRFVLEVHTPHSESTRRKHAHIEEMSF